MGRTGNGKLRVLAALRIQGARGVTRVDFQAPNVIDGGEPILNIPARIYELRHKDGHEIIEEGKRNRCTIYRLLRDAQDAPKPPPAPSAAESLSAAYVDRDTSLWGDGAVTRRLAIFDDEEFAA